MPMYCLLLFELCIADLVSYEGYTFFPGRESLHDQPCSFSDIYPGSTRRKSVIFYVDLELTPGTLRSYKLAQKIL